MSKKGPKILDPSNACKRCGKKSGNNPHSCPLASVLPGPDNPPPCNCCNRCWSKCADEV